MLAFFDNSIVMSPAAGAWDGPGPGSRLTLAAARLTPFAAAACEGGSLPGSRSPAPLKRRGGVNDLLLRTGVFRALEARPH